MKKNKNGKRYFELKNRIVYFKTRKHKDYAVILPAVGFSPTRFFEKKGDSIMYPVKCISITFWTWRFEIIFEDKFFAEYI